MDLVALTNDHRQYSFFFSFLLSLFFWAFSFHIIGFSFVAYWRVYTHRASLGSHSSCDSTLRDLMERCIFSTDSSHTLIFLGCTYFSAVSVTQCVGI
jgi:hypothetical protein